MKYTLTLLMLSGLTSHVGMRLGGWWHLLHWFSVSCLIQAAGYAGLGPRVFGKRPDGSFPLWSRVLHFPSRLFSGGLWHLARVVNRGNPTDWVGDELILGRRLRIGEVPANLANYVDLTAEMEDPVAIRQAHHYLALPVLDGSVPSREALHAAIARLQPGVTFVHCAQGHGRTALFALALLAERGRIHSLEEGLTLLTAARPGIKLNQAQAAFIKIYIAEPSGS